jgi:uncharacterized protein (TIGR03437 family)
MFAQAPTWDTSGNGMLNGTYYFREVVWSLSGGDEYAMYGQVVFNGNGTYTMTNISFLDYGNQQINTGSASGTYSMGAGGLGFLSDPIQSGLQIKGMVANGIFIGSTTESTAAAGAANNLFIAAQVPANTPTAATFNGSYTMSYLNYPSPLNGYPYDAQFTLSANGSGSVTAGGLSGYYLTNTATTTQGSTTAKYVASNGAISITFPKASASATLLNGSEYVYFSPDGNFVFGGSPDQPDMMVGVKNTSGSTLTNGLWYNVGAYFDESSGTSTSCGSADLDSYYGSFDVSGGIAIAHQRLFSGGCFGVYSSIFTDSNPSSVSYETYTVGDNGTVRIGFGQPPYLGIDLALAAPSLSGSGVYLNPTGVLNYGSYAPFTSGVSPGEIITLFGTNLAPGSQSASAAEVQTQLPTILNGVEVLIDGIKAPLYYVTPGQIVAIVPYAVSTFSVATIEVKNGTTTSNVVSEFVNLTTPGAPTYPVPNGISDVAALQYDANGNASIVSESNPAQPGNTVAVYVAGLGAVFPPLADGSVPNQNFTVSTIAADISGTPVTLSYMGLSGFAGLYQLNFVVPTGLTPGDNLFDIAGPDSFSSEALIPIGSGGGNARPASKTAEPENSKIQKGSKRKTPRPSQQIGVDKP